MNNREILNFIESRRNDNVITEQLLDIFEGNLLEYVENSMQLELSPKSFSIARQRIPAINIFKRIIKRLSKLYGDEPRRLAAESSDQEMIDTISFDSNIQSVMAKAENMLNLARGFALEPYIDEGEIHVRVLSPHEFAVISDDEKNPLKKTVFVKYMGTKTKGDEKNLLNVNVYWVYTKDEFKILHSDGEIELSEPNPYGVIPFVYATNAISTLMPKADRDSLSTTVLIPKLLADLNFATQFQSHSIMYTIDAELSHAHGSPDAVWNLKSITDGEQRKSPTVGVLSPTVDTPKVLSLIGFTVSQWLESKGLKPGSIGQMNGDNAASGIAKIIDESDTTQVVKENKSILTKAERELWWLIGRIVNIFNGTGILIYPRGFSEDLLVSISFPEYKPLPDPEERRKDIQFKLDNFLTTKRMALKEMNPDLTDEELDKLEEEIKLEKEESVKEAQAAMMGQNSLENDDSNEDSNNLNNSNNLKNNNT